mmetsp:Transcript_1010/g.2436  ORF Transcript_1010/g.2436 Transcript_1010/m.2436 type:complete len:86 (+) Transcript_1010:1245-1502(+)|eukprot:CAMPEP_0171565742 /NCGR_PEP_ID=MMETSP0961-20121227/145_1 /TAXON_ID=87120 /ORGANISM="Aurantiochytrium limacinum, Strain ATCCMYA-1381" /LENGTH=85 /DNA_ID=CAMNT_0012119329 /DNA_START=1160 /DNA_END=1417 /DNA_ORIENTATION=+
MALMTAMKMMVGTQHQEPGGFEGRSQKFKDNTSSRTASPQTALRVLRGTYSILQGVVYGDYPFPNTYPVEYPTGESTSPSANVLK